MINTIKSVKRQGAGYLLNGTMSVPNADGNLEYELIKKLIAEGNIPEAELTEKELQKKAEAKAVYDRKYVGIEYTNLSDEVYIVSLTNDDANGLIQVKTAFEFGITETNFKCSNGIVVPINSLEDLIHLGEFVVTERNKFFV